MNFKNTYIKLKDSDKTVERIKEIADKHSLASGCELEEFLSAGDIDIMIWDYVFLGDEELIKVTRKTDYIQDLQEITEQDLDNYLLTQLPSNEEDAKECCEGVVEGTSNDEEIINDVTKWGCFKEVANVLGEEDAEFELNKVKMKYLDGCEELDLDVRKDFCDAFFWDYTPQGYEFWEDLSNGGLPEEYKKVPFKPTLSIDKDVLERIKGTFKEDSIGSLVEKLYTSLSPSNVTIAVNGTGQIVIYGDKIPTVDVTKLEADEITKAYEAMVMLEGLFVGFDGEEL